MQRSCDSVTLGKWQEERAVSSLSPLPPHSQLSKFQKTHGWAPSLPLWACWKGDKVLPPEVLEEWAETPEVAPTPARRRDNLRDLAKRHLQRLQNKAPQGNGATWSSSLYCREWTGEELFNGPRRAFGHLRSSFLKRTYVCAHVVCICSTCVQVPAEAWRGHRTPWRLELPVGISHAVWELGTEHQCSAGVASVLTHESLLPLVP